MRTMKTYFVREKANGKGCLTRLKRDRDGSRRPRGSEEEVVASTATRAKLAAQIQFGMECLVGDNRGLSGTRRRGKLNIYPRKLNVR